MQRPVDAYSCRLDQRVCKSSDVIQNSETGQINTAPFALVFSGSGEFEDEARHARQTDRETFA
jgi:hypothetical protein